MSYQRAVVNCRECYRVAESIKESSFLLAEKAEKAKRCSVENLSREVYDIRNQAMQALEGCLRSTCDRSISVAEEELSNKANKALTACMNCELKQPEIAEIFDPSDPCAKDAI